MTPANCILISIISGMILGVISGIRRWSWTKHFVITFAVIALQLLAFYLLKWTN